jgi:RimJ/RimL family protein N-acetyltransferase
VPAGRWSIEAPSARGLLRAFEPSQAEVARAADQLAAWYNDEHNRAMMTGEQTMSAADVVAFYDARREAGDRAFFLEEAGLLVGDADLRSVARGRAEFAILIGPRAAQGLGLGRRFATMLHRLAFDPLALDVVYVVISPANLASRRMFETLGYQLDAGPTARSYAEKDDEIAMSLVPAALARAQAEFLRTVRYAPVAPA